LPWDPDGVELHKSREALMHLDAAPNYGFDPSLA
jgi:hypothetical protein